MELLLYQWRKYFSAKGADSFPGDGNSIQNEEVKELQFLKRTNARLEKENEILKKNAVHHLTRRDLNYEFILANYKIYSIQMMCRLLHIFAQEMALFI